MTIDENRIQDLVIKQLYMYYTHPTAGPLFVIKIERIIFEFYGNQWEAFTKIVLDFI